MSIHLGVLTASAATAAVAAGTWTAQDVTIVIGAVAALSTAWGSLYVNLRSVHKVVNSNYAEIREELNESRKEVQLLLAAAGIARTAVVQKDLDLRTLQDADLVVAVEGASEALIEHADTPVPETHEGSEP